MDRREFLGSLAIPFILPGEGAELVVMVVDKTHPDVYANQTHLKRGDVIEVLAPGSNWGRHALVEPTWMIIKVPGMSLREANALKTVDPGNRRVNPMLHARAFGLDMEKLPLVGDGRRRLMESITVSAEEIRAVKYRKAPVANPFVIG